MPAKLEPGLAFGEGPLGRIGLAGNPVSAARRLRRRAYWLLTLLFLGLVRVSPVSWGRWSGAFWGRLALRLRRRERRRGLDNLALVFPAGTAADRQALLNRSAVALGRNFFDMLAAGRLVAESRMVREEPGTGEPPEDFAQVVHRLHRRGRGVLILTGHFGCWELLGAWISLRLADGGLGPLGVVTGTIHNPPVDRLVQGRRRALGMKVLPRDRGARGLLGHLRGGGVAAVLVDQNLDAADPPVPFCGHPAPTPAGPARMALKLGTPVLPVAVGREPGTGVHVVRRLEVIEPWVHPGDSGSARAIEEFLAAWNAGLEEFLRRNPEEWVWFHDRWNRRPQCRTVGRKDE